MFAVPEDVSGLSSRGYAGARLVASEGTGGDVVPVGLELWSRFHFVGGAWRILMCEPTGHRLSNHRQDIV